MSKWNPIETAPRDGTVVLLAAEGGLGQHPWRIELALYTRGAWYDLFGKSWVVNSDAPVFWQPAPYPTEDNIDE